MDRVAVVGNPRSKAKNRRSASKEKPMPARWSKKWYKRVGAEWDRYVGDRATVGEYAAGGAPYLTRLRQDLQKWWGDHPQPAKRLTPEEIEAVARRLADLLKAYTSPITPSETVQQFRAQWLTFANNVIPDDAAKGTPMHGRSAISDNEGDEG
jgi:hypothetical protein